MTCVIALTLAATAAWHGSLPQPLVQREGVSAREPLPIERADRPTARAIVAGPGPKVYFVTETPLEVMVTKPCLTAPPSTSVTTPRVEAESRQTP